MPDDADALKRRLEQAAWEQKPPLLASSAPATPSAPAPTRSLALAFLAAAVAAFVGGLLWAAITIATGYNLGILALLIGAVTGLTARTVAGARIGGFEKGLAALLAAGAVIVGDYVIFVHVLKNPPAGFALRPGVSVGYFNSDEMSEFTNHFGTWVHGFDWLWIGIAAYAAFRTSGGGRVLGMGGRGRR